MASHSKIIVAKTMARLRLGKDNRNNIILALASTLLSLVSFAVLIEIIWSYRYDNWKSTYANNGDWYGGLTTISENAILMWEYRPNAESDGLEAKIRTNRYGFRDYDYEYMARPAETFRIAFIGDSVTLGFGVESQDVFVERFASYAAEIRSDQNIQPMNFGIDGYNTIQIYELLKTKALDFEPNKVVYVMCFNDFDFEQSAGGKVRYFRKPNSFILEKIESLYREFRGIDFNLWHFRKNKEQIFNTIFDMKKFLNSQNIDFQIIILPIFMFKDSDKSFDSYPLSEMHVEVKQFLIESNIDSFDFLDVLEFQDRPPEYFARDLWHPNKEGHDFFARRMLDFVVSE